MDGDQRLVKGRYLLLLWPQKVTILIRFCKDLICLEEEEKTYGLDLESQGTF